MLNDLSTRAQAQNYASLGWHLHSDDAGVPVEQATTDPWLLDKMFMEGTNRIQIALGVAYGVYGVRRMEFRQHPHVLTDGWGNIPISLFRPLWRGYSDYPIQSGGNVLGDGASVMVKRWLRFEGNQNLREAPEKVAKMVYAGRA